MDPGLFESKERRAMLPDCVMVSSRIERSNSTGRRHLSARSSIETSQLSGKERADQFFHFADVNNSTLAVSIVSSV
jgi:hypothetical protein